MVWWYNVICALVAVVKLERPLPPAHHYQMGHTKLMRWPLKSVYEFDNSNKASTHNENEFERRKTTKNKYWRRMHGDNELYALYSISPLRRRLPLIIVTPKFFQCGQSRCREIEGAVAPRYMLRILIKSKWFHRTYPYSCILCALAYINIKYNS